MNRLKLILAIASLIGVIAIIVVAPALGQGGSGGQLPPNKQAFVATEQALQAEREKGPRAPKPTPQPPATSCPKSVRGTTGIYDFRFGPWPQGNLFINYASAVLNGMEYNVFAGAVATPAQPADRPVPLFGEPAPVYTGPPDEMSKRGLLRVVRSPIDPCAAAVAPNSSSSMQDYLYPRGPLTIIQVNGAIVEFSIAGGGTGRFNFVTGQFLP